MYIYVCNAKGTTWFVQMGYFSAFPCFPCGASDLSVPTGESEVVVLEDRFWDVPGALEEQIVTGTRLWEGDHVPDR